MLCHDGFMQRDLKQTDLLLEKATLYALDEVKLLIGKMHC